MSARLLAPTLLALALVAPAAARADGISPGAAQGGPGVVAAGVRYVALGDGRRTVVVARSTRTGALLARRVLPGRLGLPLVTFRGTVEGLSTRGNLLVLQALADPRGRRLSRFVLLDLRLRHPRGLVLRGDLAYDALSPLAWTLFLVQHPAPADQDHYVVRAYDLRTGRLRARPVVDPREVARMHGYPLARAWSPDARWAYTLYGTGTGPFVHALDTIGRRAVCVDLPWHGRALGGLGALRLETDGRTLTLRGPHGAPAARVDTRTFRVTAARTTVRL